jgi:hypothetical protein
MSHPKILALLLYLRQDHFCSSASKEGEQEMTLDKKYRFFIVIIEFPQNR